MKFNWKDVVFGLVILLVIFLSVLFYKKYKTPKPLSTSTPPAITFKEDLEASFRHEIPDDVNTIELKDVSGGDSRGIATEKEILVDANDPETSYFYEGWLEKTDGTLISIGKLQVAKGGWLLEYDKNIFPDVSKVIISLEKQNDRKLEKRILEGSF